jgi:hypothetical protein
MPEPDALAAALLQLSEHADKLNRLDAREAAHAAETAERTTAITTLTAAMKHTLDDQANILAGLKDLDHRLQGLTARIDDLASGPDDSSVDRSYQPAPTPRFWKPGCAPGSNTSTSPATAIWPRP